ncbi:MAG TPA: carboxypeptidase regulatory-like domain-containing protein, partial [Ktedonobacterales bacterium]|nr:carboxypeptidase regulatory-like domain-containing protein [Ktedonobacterales bacterium]
MFGHNQVKTVLARIASVSLTLAIASFSLVSLAPSGVALAAGSLHITGTVTNQSGGGVLNVSVTATAPGGTTTLFGPSATDSSGAYDLAVDPGTYDIHFDPPSGSGLNPIVDSNLAVSASQTLNVQLTSLQHTLSGVVRDSSGDPMPSMQLTFQETTTHATVTATTNTSGAYSVAAVAGVYAVIGAYATNPDPLGYMNIHNQLSISSMPHYDLTTSDATQDFTVPLAPLNVTVKDGFGNPVSGAAVNVYSTSSTFSLVAGEGAYYYNTGSRGATTNSQGVAAPLVFQSTYGSGTVCAVVSGNQICNASSITVGSGGASLLFQAAPQAPPAPTGLTAATPTASAPALSWNAVSVAASYNVYRDGQKIGNTTTTSFTDSALVLSGSYTYTVTAVSALNVESSASSPFVVVFNGQGPIVTNVQVTPNSISLNQTATLTADVSDSFATVTAAEYYEGTDPGEGNG